MTNAELIAWLMEGDVAIQYQTSRDLLGIDNTFLRKQIATQGWGARFLACRQPNGHWGRGFYQPKWTSTHYTLLDLKNLGIWPHVPEIKETLQMIFENEKGVDGGINPHREIIFSDVCISGMALNYGAYFGVDEKYLTSVVDYLLGEHMPDGGFNCQTSRSGATHSSVHTTLSVLEGINEYKRNGYKYRLDELETAELASREFLLMHRLFRSDKTGEIINPNFLKLCYPGRWYYDILKAMDYFQCASVSYDERMQDAIDVLLKKRNKEGQWKLAANHPGQTHFEMEQAGIPSRWNTLRALRVLKWYGISAG